MKIKFVSIFALVALTLSCGCWAASEAMPKNGFIGGTGEAVKAWTPRAFDALKGGYSPLAVYIYDHENKKNSFAFGLEGSKGLNSADVKDKLSKFSKIKVKSDGTDAKGWPAAMLQNADKSSVLILMSSDLTMQLVFDKSKDAGERSAQSIMAAATAILAHEDKLKAIAEKEDKKNHPEVMEKPKEKEADFTIKVDGPKPAAKKPDAKVADAKNAADAKAAGAMPADGKMAAKKSTSRRITANSNL